jgi:hypothetical protein
LNLNCCPIDVGQKKEPPRKTTNSAAQTLNPNLYETKYSPELKNCKGPEKTLKWWAGRDSNPGQMP